MFEGIKDPRSEAEKARHKKYIDTLTKYAIIRQQPHAKVMAACEIVGAQSEPKEKPRAVYRRLQEASQNLNRMSAYHPKEVERIVKLLPNLIYGEL